MNNNDGILPLIFIDSQVPSAFVIISLEISQVSGLAAVVVCAVHSCSIIAGFIKVTTENALMNEEYAYEVYVTGQQTTLPVMT